MSEMQAGCGAAEYHTFACPAITAHGYLMVDGYTGYNKVKDIRRYCCFAHIRRYFFDAIPKGKQSDISIPAVQGVEYCDKLFAYERHFKEKGYAYKFRMLFTVIVSKPVAIGIEEEAKAYLDSIDDLRLTKRENMTDEQKNSFLARLYPDNEPNSAFKLEECVLQFSGELNVRESWKSFL